MKIGELARRAGIAVTTVRYYESRGLLPAPARSEGGQRRYPAAALQRLLFVRHARALGVELAQIARLLALRDEPGAPCAEAEQIVQRHLGAVRERIDALQQLESELSRIAAACPGGRAGECAAIAALGDHRQCAGEHRPVADGGPSARPATPSTQPIR